MLHYLPKPKPDELLYSVFARYAVHMGNISAKQCLDDLFGCRTVVATVDLPSHMDAFLANAGHLWDISPEALIYEHTLFPLYAPFVPETRRQSALLHMRSGDGRALHVQLGISASTISPPTFLRFCPACLNEQLSNYGEYFWQRSWQVTGLNVCRCHGPLLESNVRFRHLERHRFVPATPSACQLSPIDAVRRETDAIHHTCNNLISELLRMPLHCSPTYHQWSQLYHEVAVEAGCANGAHIRHQELMRDFHGAWRGDYEEIKDLAPNWLVDMFRKHKKSFSYLQHVAVWASFLPKMTVPEVLQWALSFPKRHVVSISQAMLPSQEIDLMTYRSNWCRALDSFSGRGIKWVRANISGMSATYAWLYRHDRTWLIKINKQHRIEHPGHSERVNWPARDQALFRKLRTIAQNNDSILTRRTKNWYINQLPQSASIEKNLAHLPLLSALLTETTESVANYQIRRCKYALEELASEGVPTARWRVERRAGIGMHNIKPATERFLAKLDGVVCDENNDPQYPE